MDRSSLGSDPTNVTGTSESPRGETLASVLVVETGLGKLRPEGRARQEDDEPAGQLCGGGLGCNPCRVRRHLLQLLRQRADERNAFDRKDLADLVDDHL